VQFPDLFADQRPAREELRPGMVLLRGRTSAATLLPAVEAVATAAPFRHLSPPGGKRMSVAMTNCGGWGWISDPRGYRYEPRDPDSGRPWPPIPAAVRALAEEAAAEAGFPGFRPDACLVNRYAAGTRLTAHRDEDEADFAQPIVSVSLGLPATFLVHGETRGGSPQKVTLEDGDVLVFGGPARLLYHGVAPVAVGDHPVTGPWRYNLTLRRAR